MSRWLLRRLPPQETHRIVVVTGARQTGKTTLMKRAYPGLRYINLDSAENRDAVRLTAAASWGRSVGDAVIDEVQKEASVLEKLKYAFDEGAICFSALTGSSRLLLLRQVRETLAGRTLLLSLWPLMASELAGSMSPPLFDLLLTAQGGFQEILGGQQPILLGDDEARQREALEHLALWGGMPALLPLQDEERRDWLRSYIESFVESDLTDYGRLQDLEPFRRLVKVAMLRCGGLLSVSELARDAGVSPQTAGRYLTYLELSFQTINLPPFSRNLTSTVVKAPKLYWSDLGILRRATWQYGDLTGPQFENLVVCEAHKWIESLGRDARLSFYRTRSGLELDLLIQTPAGVIGMEIKNRPSAHKADISSMLRIAEALGSEWLCGLVVNRGTVLEALLEEKRIWSVPVHRLFC